MRALGLMSGTSLDGIDAAVIETDGIDIQGFGPSAGRPYETTDREVLRNAFGWEPAPTASALIDQRHIEAVEALNEPVDLIGYHGQTVAHDPDNGRTRQLGDGSVLANALDTSVVWDFRSDDMIAGGQGAPLAPFYHWACARWIKAKEPVAFLNLGGVGNVTWVDPTTPCPETPGALLAFDTGPGNALIDDLMLTRMGRGYDLDGEMGAAGKVNKAVLHSLESSPYFAVKPPKSLDRDDFAHATVAIADLSTEDAAATLTAFTASSVAKAAKHLPSAPSQWLVCGGGRLNPTMMRMLSDGLAVPVLAVEEVGLDGDMLEAQAFAYLAVRVLHGLPTSAPGTTGCTEPVSGGQISA
ncbi:MAG: anhydro-N-acetylmuramic acid kinase [Pikeienuella sp.]